MASFEKKMAGYGDAVVATAAVLARVGLPSVVQGYWTEHSERSVLPTALAILGVTDSEKRERSQLTWLTGSRIGGSWEMKRPER